MRVLRVRGMPGALRGDAAAGAGKHQAVMYSRPGNRLELVYAAGSARYYRYVNDGFVSVIIHVLMDLMFSMLSLVGHHLNISG